jgi:hypothetical protein
MLVRYFTLISPDVSFVSAIFGGDGPNRSTNPSRAGYPLIAAADDLRQWVGDMKTLIAAELRDEIAAELDAKIAAPVERLEAKVAAAEERDEAAEDRARALETTVAELRGRIGGDVAGADMGRAGQPHEDGQAA